MFSLFTIAALFFFLGFIAGRTGLSVGKLPTWDDLDNLSILAITPGATLSSLGEGIPHSLGLAQDFILSHAPPLSTMIGYIALATLALTIAVLFHSISTSEARAHSTYADELAMRQQLHAAKAQRMAKQYSWYRFLHNHKLYADKRARTELAKRRAQIAHQLRTSRALLIAVGAVVVGLFTFTSAGSAVLAMATPAVPTHTEESTMDNSTYTEDIFGDVKRRFQEGEYKDASYDWLQTHTDYFEVQIRSGRAVINVMVPFSMEGEIIVNEEGTDEYRYVPVDGQESRLGAVIELLDAPNQNRHAIERKLESVIDYQMAELHMEYRLAEEKGLSGRARRTARNWLMDTIPFLADRQEDKPYRRVCALTKKDYRFVKMVRSSDEELTQEELEEALEECFDDAESFDSDESSMRLDNQRRNGLERGIRKHVVRSHAADGFRFLGGNPDKGILVFVKETACPATPETSQRYAKMLLRGGTQLQNGPIITARVIDFPEDADDMDQWGGYRDGLFAIMSHAMGLALAKANGMERGDAWQGHMIRAGSFAMKGMLAFVRKVDPSEGESLSDKRQLLGESDMVISRKLYNRIFDAGVEHGTIVHIIPEDIWVMGKATKADTMPSEFSHRLSFQSISRAPVQLQRYFRAIIEAKLAEWKELMQGDDKLALIESQLIPSFGDYMTMLKASMRPILKEDHEEGYMYKSDSWINAISKAMAVIARRGIKIPGAAAYLQHCNSLTGMDALTRSEDIETGEVSVDSPGIRVPSWWGLDVGDHVLMFAYPVLGDHDEWGQSTGLVMFVVEDTHNKAWVDIHGSVALASLRDADGDKPLFHSPKMASDADEDTAFPDYVKNLGVSQAELSTKKEDSEKASILTEDLTALSLRKGSELVLKSYLGLAAKVGSVDNIVTSAMLYMTTEELMSTDTPSTNDDDLDVEETWLRYMSKCVQASIEGMKHETHEVYSKENLLEGLAEILPEELFNEHGSLVKHPILHVRSPRVAKKSGGFFDMTVEKPTMADVMREVSAYRQAHKDADHDRLSVKRDEGAMIWMDMIQGMDALIKEGVSNDGFGQPDHYEEAGLDIYDEASFELVESDERLDYLSELSMDIISEARAIRERHVDESDEAEEGQGRDFEGEKTFLKRRSAELDLMLDQGKLTKAEVFMIDLSLVTSKSIYQAMHFCRARNLKAVAAVADGEVMAGWDALAIAGMDKRHRLTSSTCSRKALKAFKEDFGTGRSSHFSGYVRGEVARLTDGPVMIKEVEDERHDKLVRRVNGRPTSWKLYNGPQPGIYEVRNVTNREGRSGNVVLKSITLEEAKAMA